MNKAIDQALTSLLPTLNAPPAALANLSASLLAQSRAKAGNLKPGEEISRTYACTHIACERLKQSLNLPTIDPQPPCPPRIYKKLYQYLNDVLPGNEPIRPKKRRANVRKDDPTTPSRIKVKQDTPTSKPTIISTPEAGQSTGRKRKITESAGHDGEGDIPNWTMPVIRHLCKALNAPAATPHVYAGLCTVMGTTGVETITLSVSNGSPMQHTKRANTRGSITRGKPSHIQSPSKNDVTAALIAVLYLYTMVRLSPQEISEQDYIDQKTQATAKIREKHSIQDTDDDHFDALIEKLIREAQSGWLELEWFTNIPEGQGIATTSAFALADHENADEKNQTSGLSEDGLHDLGFELRDHGPGSMFVGAVDYLSEDRRRDYKKWKAQMIKRIEEIESEQAGSAG